MSLNFIIYPQRFSDLYLGPWGTNTAHKQCLYPFNHRMMHGLFPHIPKIAYSYFILSSCTSLQFNCADRTYTEISPCPPAVFSLQRPNYTIHVFQKQSLKSHESVCWLVCVDSIVQLKNFWEWDLTSIIYSLLTTEQP